MKQQLAVFDLDGTLVKSNTFHQWNIFLLKKFLRKGQILKVLIIGFCIALRLARLVSHSYWKIQVIKLSASMGDQELSEFVKSVYEHTNEKVYEYLKSFMEKGDLVLVLSTAAPEVYASSIGNYYGFHHTIATPSVIDSDWKENYGTRKLQLLKEAFTDFDLVYFFSDHISDLPLFEIAEKPFLVYADEECKSELNSAVANLKIIE